MSAERIEAAVSAAIAFFDKMYKDKGLKDVLMEEVRERDENTWEVTIGYSRVVQESPPMVAITQGAKYQRICKVLAVDKESGDVTSMTLRSV